ncbi:MAG: pyridoxine 5'-phosphate synthase, partial [Planctomycetota bacterium]
WKRDLPLLGAVVKTVFSIEIPHGLGDLDHLFEYDPQILTLIPTLSNHEGTTAEGVDGGLDVAGSPTVYAGVFKRMRQAGVAPSVLIDADVEQVSAARDVGGERVLLYTGGYARVGPQGDPGELARIEEASIAAVELGLSVAAGGGLTRRNLPDLLSIPMIDEVVIGHAIMARAMFIGFENAVQEILDLMPRGAEEP